ncbi:hypothetical protein PIB30_045979 [Stylosanthes scabra]|uniref:Uncharacterized protein n=1 Tax=Stylosanthes scabra TaxID=79078 RepID=A0ABU6TGP0_9FABA|nr:hypothetical protein [Stylosanthes scabra]
MRVLLPLFTTMTKLNTKVERVLNLLIRVQGVKYGCLAIEGDDDLQNVFHCRRQFSEVRTTELFAEVADSLASFGGSAPHPRPVNVGGSSGSRHQAEIDVPQVASPSFDFNLQPEAAIGGTELGDYSRFGVPEPDGAIPPPVSLPAFEGVPKPDPQVEKALRADDSDVEPEFIEEDSDDETGPAPPPQRDTSSSGTQQYPRHLLNLNLDALSGPGRGASGSSSGAQASQGSSTPAEFVVGQSFHTKEEAVLAVKNYNIRRGGEYRELSTTFAGALSRYGSACGSRYIGCCLRTVLRHLIGCIQKTNITTVKIYSTFMLK